MGDNSEICEVVVTGRANELAGIARELLDQHLIACAQIIEKIRAIYRWQGAIEDESQARAAFHTRMSLADAVTSHVNFLHTDEVPCILVVPVVGAHEPYREWVLEETRAGVAGLAS